MTSRGAFQPQQICDSVIHLLKGQKNYDVHKKCWTTELQMVISAQKKEKLMLPFGSMPRSDRSLTCTPKCASQAEIYLLGYQWH